MKTFIWLLIMAAAIIGVIALVSSIPIWATIIILILLFK